MNARIELDGIARARQVAPIVANAAERIEAARELPPDVLAALHGAGLFRLLLPRSIDGEEIDPVELAQVTEVIAAADASTAWCLSQGAVSAMASAFLDPIIAREVFGPREAVLAWGAGTAGKAVAAPGGYRVTGSWSFASGSRHATWIGGHCLVFEADGSPRRRPDGRQADRTALFRRADVAIRDTWQVMGLRGTGSDSYSVTDAFVPDAYTLDREDPAERREAGTVYKFQTTQCYAAGFSGVALGIARGALEALKALAMEKTPRGASSSLRENPVFQSQLAELEGQWRAARAYVLQSYGEVWPAVERAGALTLGQRVALRLATTFAINQATGITTQVYRMAGATAIFETQPFERRLRDALAVSQQAQARPSHFLTVGRHLLGLAPDTMMFM